MPRKLAAVYTVASTAVAILAIVISGTVFGFFTSNSESSADEPAGVELVAATASPAIDSAPAYRSALATLDSQRVAALNDAAAQVAAQRAALQEQALREVDAQRRAALQALADELDATRARAQAAATVSAPAAPSPVPTISRIATAPSDTRQRELLGEIAKKTAECDRERGDDRQECLAEVDRLRRRAGL